MISFSERLRVLFSVFLVVEGTLIPNGTVLLDCGSQQTFTCSVTGAVAGWTISGLDGISVTVLTGLATANNTRIMTTDTTGTSSSTITIDGFTTADNGGTITCFDIANNNVQGMITVSVDVPSQLINVDARLIEVTSVQITWDVPSTSPPVTSVTVTCMPPPLNCGTCPPSGPCTISGLNCNTKCHFTVTPENNCGNGSASSVSATKSSTAPPPPTTPPPTLGLPIVIIVVPIVAAIILVVLVVIIVIVVVIWCMKKKHGVKACPCIKKKEKKNGGGDVIYEDPEKNNDNIKMQSSPAYQTVSSVCGTTKGDYYYSEVTDDVKMEPSPAYQTVS